MRSGGKCKGRRLQSQYLSCGRRLYACAHSLLRTRKGCDYTAGVNKLWWISIGLALRREDVDGLKKPPDSKVEPGAVCLLCCGAYAFRFRLP